ncbi:MAG: hypothetical protein KC900_05070 [Candidatus Omnitrophica bacterium]|nr:hypothetical protein [Candidatus Omnitrophota bacterium]
MFRKLLKNKKAQNTAEYAILISLVVAGIIAMQTYAQRALQARVRDAGQYLASQSAALGNTNQYEPYYLTTNYLVSSNSAQTQLLDNQTIRTELDNNRTRASGGFQTSAYDTSLGLIQGL